MNIKYNQLCIRNAEKKDCEQLAVWWNDGTVMAHAGFPNGLGTSAAEIEKQIADDSDETRGARKLAEKEQTDIRLYSVIYQAIEELKSAMEGMLSPEIKEEIIATVEVLETFKISKVGTIAGCIVRDGKITRTAKIRVIREGIVIYTGVLGSLKRFKDDVKEVTKGFECGLNIENYNDIRVGDMIEGYQEVEVKKTL